jgi:alpha-beta hydrolase superfamily lysophospholipase
MNYRPDILGNGFEQAIVQQPDDYEGPVICTVIRKLCHHKTGKAVLHVHGYNDYFFHSAMADRFITEGFNFYAVDLRKYGRSWLPHQKMNNVRDLGEYFADIGTVLQIIKYEGAQQVVLSGHSMGGLIITLYADAQKGEKLFDGLFLNSPFFDMNMHPILRALLIPLLVRQGVKCPDKLAKGGFSPLYGESLHKDAKGEWTYDLAWKPHLPLPFNYGWLRAIRMGQKKLASGIYPGKPVLVMHSVRSVYRKKWSEDLFSGDAILNVKDIMKRARCLREPYIILAIEGGMHDLVLSPKHAREIVYSSLFKWLRIL